MTITDYLNDVFDSFRSYIDATGDVCKLREVTYEAGNVPDYEDIQVQELYILKYTFSYAFEYMSMYSEILDFFNGAQTLKILSLGCGTMTDYWSLIQALNKTDFEIRPRDIHYTGVDRINWSHKFPNRLHLPYRFEQQDMIEYIERTDISDTNIFFFPKSICEIPDMDGFCSVLSNCGLNQSKIVLGVSLRDQDHNREEDMMRTDRMIQAICHNGYRIINDSNNTAYEYLGIRKYDTSFLYPEGAKEYILSLYEKCTESESCDDDCELIEIRQPITTTSYILYRIILFERIQP